ncbi:Rho GTPase activation protein [Phascolomyces articulosus]|uniref:Rho GTPase activation protein n=1 Tax=Phascolomyces articulosus TaxID=60185 RepID=A0AAD5JTV9_9FUNG|nr:Rho GTPase activation protein [Phascolomyces articulosus]
MKSFPQECLNNKKDSSSNDNRHRSMSIHSTRSSVVFGNDLCKQVQMENSTIPLIVRRCVEAVEVRGMEVEGIYRKSGGAKQMREIQELFDIGQPPDLTDDNHWNDINAVTSVLKQYFRKLPDPLFTYQLHHEFIKNTYIKNPSTRFDEIQLLIHKLLPTENRDTIQYIMCHLFRVQERSNVNYMNARNLAVIFGPTLLRNTDEASDLLEMSCKIETISYILHHCEALFGC